MAWAAILRKRNACLSAQPPNEGGGEFAADGKSVAALVAGDSLARFVSRHAIGF